MNNVFRLIWNRTLGRLVVASEAARSRNKAATQQGVVGQLPAPEVAGGASVSTLLRPVALAVAIATGTLVVQPVQANIINTASTCTTPATGTVGRVNPGVTSAQAQDGLGTYSLAAGCNASGNNQLAATVYGAFSQVTGTGGSAFGHNAHAAKWATAIGVESRATGNSAIALGFGGQATALNAIAIGSAGGNGTTPLSIANSTTASGQHSIAIGSDNVRGAQASGIKSIALGAQATADLDNSLAVGVKASAAGQSSVAVGDTAIAGTTRDIAIGNSAETGSIVGATGSQADNVAIGTGALALGGTAIAIGEGATATGTNTANANSVIAIGRQAKANDTAALALGSHASTGEGASYAAAIGPKAKVGDNASNSVAIGTSATVADKATASTAVGQDATVNASISVAVGQGATVATGAFYSTAVGRQATVNSNSSVAIGQETNVAINAAHGTAIGSAAKVLEGAVSGMAFGTNAQVMAKGDIAMGRDASVDGTSDGGPSIGLGADVAINGSADATAIGSNAKIGSDSSGATAIGSEAVVGDLSINSTAIGRLSSIGDSAWDSVALGSAATVGEGAAGSVSIGRSATNAAEAYSSVALGIGTSNDSPHSIAMGNYSTTSASNAIAIGSDAEAAKNAIAMGHDAKATGSQSIAMGNGAEATGSQSISIGTGNVVSGNGSGAIGDPTTITGAGSYSLGNDNTIDADEAGTFGNDNVLAATATGSRIIGNGNDIDVADAFVMGNDADVTVAEGVALGNGSIADTGAGVAGYNPTTSAADALDAGIVATQSTTGAVAVGDAGNGIYRQITGVAAGTADSDAVNVAQLKASETHYYSVNDNGVIGGNYANDGATGVNALAAGVGATAGGVGAVAVGNGTQAFGTRSTALGDGTSAGGENAAAVGTDANAAGEEALAFGFNADAQDINAIAIGSSSVASSTNAMAIGREANAAGEYAIAIGSGTVASGNLGTAIGNNAIAGVNDTAIGAGALTASSGTEQTTAVGFGSGANVTNGQRSTYVGASAGDSSTGVQNSFQGYAAGGNVNGMNNVAQGTAAGAAVTGNSNVALGEHAGTLVRIDPVTGAPVTIAAAEFDDAVNIGRETQALADSAVAVGAGATAMQVGAVALGQGSIADGSTLGTAAYQPLDVNGNPATVAAPTADSEVSVGSAGNERRIINVAAGAEDTDAVNVSQLKAVNEVASAGWDLTANGEAVGENIAPGETADFSEGKNIAITRTGNSIAVATADDVEFNQVTIGDATDPANSTVITNVGGALDVGGDKITNVQAGDISNTSTDAVNGSQLFATNQNVATNTTNITNNTTEIGKGINFGDGATSNNYALGDTLNVKGDPNVTSTTTGDGVQLGLANVLNVGTTNTVTIDGDAGTIGGLTNKTWDPANTPITSGQAATEDQLKTVSDVANAGWNVQTTDDAAAPALSNVAPSKNVDFVSSDDNVAITHTQDANGDTQVDYTLSNELAVGEAGPAGEDGYIGVDGKDGVSGVAINGKDGSIGLTGPSGTNGTISVIDGKAGVNGVDGVDGITRIVIDDIEVATMEDGLKFSGNDNPTDGFVTRKLNEEMQIVGGATATNADGSPSAYSSDNIRTVATQDGGIEIQLAESPTFGGDLTVEGDTYLGDNFSVVNNEAFYNVEPDQITNDYSVVNKKYVDGIETHYYSVNDFGVQGDNYDNDGASGAGGLAAGVYASAAGISSTAVGFGAEALGNYSSAFGARATASGRESMSAGYNASAIGYRSVALGANATASADYSTAIGRNASVEVTAGVALGQFSQSDTPSGVAGYDPLTGSASIDPTATWVSSAGAVSVGHLNGGEHFTRQITNVAAGSEDSDAVNVAQLKRVSQVASAGWNVQTTDDSATPALSNVAPSKNVDFVSSDDNVAITHTQDANGDTQVDYTLSNELAVGEAGPAGEDGYIGVDGKDGISGVAINGKDGSIGLTGPSGTNGTISVIDGKAGVNGVDGVDGITRIVIDDIEVATMEDGLKFSGNDNPADGFVTRKLNEEMQIVGGAKATNADGTDSAYSSDNIRTVATQDGGIEIQLAESPTFGGDLTVEGDTYLGDNFSVVNNEAFYNVEPDQITNDYSVVNKKYVDGIETHYYSVNSSETGAGSNYDNDGATGVNALAAGVNALASGASSVAIGNGADASGLGSVALGNNEAGGNYAVAMGHQTTASGEYSTAMGDRTTASGVDSTAMGRQTTASGYYSTAMGRATTASSQDSTAMGWGTTASGIASTAMGGQTAASAPYSTAMGFRTTASSHYSTSMGDSTTASGVTSTAMGWGTTASGGFSTAMGWDTTASGFVSTAMGVQGNAQGESSFAFGGNEPGEGSTYAYTDGSIAMGQAAIAGQENGEQEAVAIGYRAQATGDKSLSLGFDSVASGSESLAIGSGNVVSGDNSGAIGDPTTITGTGSYSLGNDNTIDADEAGTFGNNNILATTATGSRIVGNGNDIDVADAFVMGNGADVTVDGGVAIGSASVASTAAGVAGYDPLTGASSTDTSATWQSTASAVSVGDAANGVTRQITGVAAGSADTDAVNVSQLKAVNDVASAGWNVQTTDDTAAPALSNVAPSKNVDFVSSDDNVAITHTQDANGDTQIDYTLSNALAVGEVGPAGEDGYIGVDGKDGVSGVAINGKDGSIGLTGPSGTNGTISVIDGKAGVNGVDGVDGITRIVIDDIEVATMEDGLKFSGNDNPADGFVTRKLNEEMQIVGGATATNADGSPSAYSSDNIRTVATQDGGIEIQLAESPTFGGDLTVEGDTYLGDNFSVVNNEAFYNVEPDQITNDYSVVNKKYVDGIETHYYSVNDDGVQQGNYDNDGATGKNSLAAGVNATATAENSVSVGFSNNADFVNAVAIGSKNEALSSNSSAIGVLNSAVGDGATAVGRQNVVDAQNAVAMGTFNTADGPAASAIGTANVASGTYSSALGHGSQALGYGATSVGDRNRVDGNHSSAFGYINSVSGYSSTAIGKENVVTGDYAAALGFRSTASGALSLAQGAYTNASGIYSMASGSGANASADYSVALGAFSVADGSTLGTAAYQPLDVNGNPATVAAPTAGSEVSIGSAGNERRITNVAAGGAPTDAVNVSQLKAVNDVASAGWNVQTTDDTAAPALSNVAPSKNVDFVSSDDNVAITHTQDANGDTQVDYTLSNALAVGEAGPAGEDGYIGVDGKDGVSGVAINGKDGSIGLTGPSGTNGTISVMDGKAGVNGVDGVDGITRIVIDDIEVATMEDGLKFSGNDNPADGFVTRKLNEEMQIVGGAKATNADGSPSAYSSDNIRTVATQDGGIEIQLAESPTFGGDLTVEGDTYLGDNFSVVNNEAFYDGPITENTHIVNKEYVDNQGDASAGGGFGLADATGTEVKQDLGATIKVHDPDGNIITTADNATGELQLSLSNDLTVGEAGPAGEDGYIGVDGKDGVSGVAINGKDGSIGLTGPSGTNGTISVIDGKAGVNGVDGVDGITRIVIDDIEVATMEDGLKFSGNDNPADGFVTRKLNEEMQIVGGATATNADGSPSAYSSDNIRTVATQDGGIEIQLAESPTFGGDLTVEGDTYLGDNFSVVNNEAFYDGAITENTHIVNKEYVDNQGDASAGGGFGLADATGTEVKQDLGATIKVHDPDGNIITTADNATGELQLSLSNDLTVGEAGPAGEDGYIGVDGKDGVSGVAINGKDGSIGLTGPSGTNGTISVIDGKAGVNGVDGVDGITRIVIDDIEVATMEDGLKFSGNDNPADGFVTRKLNEEMQIVGGATATNADGSDSAYSSDNIRTVATQDGGIEIQLAESPTFGGDLTVEGDTYLGDTYLGDNFSVVNNEAIYNVEPDQITNDYSVVNKKYVDNQGDAGAGGGFGLADASDAEVKQDLGATIKVHDPDGDIITTADNDNGELLLGLSSDLSVGGPGADGADGEDGYIGVDGKDGTTGVAIDGADGSIGLTGPAGTDGNSPVAIISPEILPGDVVADSTNVTRLTFEDGDGNSKTLATLEDDGLRFSGNDNSGTADGYVTRNLNKEMQIVGGAKATNADGSASAYSSDNIRTVATQDGGIEIQLAESPTFGGDLTVEGDTYLGDTYLGDNFSVVNNEAFYNVEPDQITNDYSVVNKKYVDNQGDAGAGGGFGLADTSDAEVKQDLGATIKVHDPDGDIITTADNANGELQLSLSNDLSVGGPGADGADGEDGYIGVDGKDGTTGVAIDGADGSIGLTGPAGADGISPQTTLRPQILPGDVVADATDVTRLTFEDGDGNNKTVATLEDDGLRFSGNDNSGTADGYVTRNLNKEMQIVGGAKATNADGSASAYSSDNIRTVATQDGGIEIQFAESPTFGGDLTVEGNTYLGDNFSVVNNEAFYDGPITGDTSIVNKKYVDQAIVTEMPGGISFFSVNAESEELGNFDNTGATGKNALAAGTSTTAAGLNATAVGNFSSASGVGTSAVGNFSNASGLRSAALGNRATATGNYSLAIGTGAESVGESSLAIGQLAKSTGEFATAVGTDADALGEQSSAFGVGSLAEGKYSLAVGNFAEALQQDSIAIGNLATASGAEATVIGVGSLAEGFGSFAAGNGSQALGDTSIAIGHNSTATGVNGIAVGAGNIVSGDNSGAFGDPNVVDGNGSYVVGNDNTVAQDNSFVVGNDVTTSQANSVVLGNASTDRAATTVSGGMIDGTAYTYAGAGSVANGVVSVGAAGAERQVINVAAGEVSDTSTDAINGSQLYATNQHIESITKAIDGGDFDTRYVNTNDEGLAESDSFAIGQGSTAVGYEAQSDGENSLALGYQAMAKLQGSVALGSNAQVGDAEIANLADDVRAAGNAHFIDLGSEDNATRYDFAGTTPVSTVSVGSVGNERTITNVAAGRITADSTDAINGSQLYAAMDFMGSLDDRLTIVEGDTGGGGTEGVVKYDRDDNGDINYDSVTLEGKDGTKLTNVADGEISDDSSDAINGSQLHDTNQNVANNTTNITDNSQRITNNEGNIADNSQRITTNENSITDINETLGLGLNFGADEGDTVNRQLGDTVAITGDDNITTKTTDDGVQITMNRDLDVDSVTTGNTTVNNDGVSIKDGPSMTVNGIDAGGTTITNVAPGVNETDAVNVGQMNELGRRFQNEIVNVHGRIDSVERNANAGSASAIAASTVPQAWMPGKSMVGVGAGTYGGESAVSVGISRLSDNGRWVIQGKVTGDSQSNFGAGIGAGWHW